MTSVNQYAPQSKLTLSIYMKMEIDLRGVKS